MDKPNWGEFVDVWKNESFAEVFAKATGIELERSQELIDSAAEQIEQNLEEDEGYSDDDVYNLAFSMLEEEELHDA